MTGDVGLGQRVLAGARTPAAEAVAGALDGLRLNQDNVLHVRNALKSEYYALGDLMRLYGPMVRLEKCGGDPVSAFATPAFNQRIDAFMRHCMSYINALGNAVVALEETARAYGYRESQIADAFDEYRRGPAAHGAQLGRSDPSR
jgi:hypothetical protein